MRAVAAFLGLAAWLAAGPVAAQGFNLSRNNDEQIQVYADEGIEWMSEANRVVARGNAKAVRGQVTVTADSLTAYYRNGPGGDEIWRLDADGNVTIQSAKETATGTKATYDLDKAIFVLRGQPAKLVTPNETFTATDALEYWEKERMAVLRGDGVAVQKDRTIRADVLAARFKDGAKGDLELKRADAYGNVVLTTAKEKVTGERGDYNAESGIATVAGSVKITRDGNELNGGYAHVNLNTGISKLFGSPPGARDGDGRVRGVFTPEKQDLEGRRALFKGAGPGKAEEKPKAGGQ
ncbi:MAG TPA: LptA/OstA family protein [Candidatus Omnitrophota bacterium]|nr:LptA/OstA family protein [Candidatus Omnitrophota bacterium]